MKRVLTVLGALVLVGCLPVAQTHTPGPPTSVSVVLAAHVNEPDGTAIAGATVSWVGGQSATTDVFGRAFIATTAPARFGFCAEAVDHLTQCLDTQLVDHDVNQTFTLARTKPAAPPFLSAGEHGALRVDGQYLRTEDGHPWQWVGASDFALFQRWLVGQDINPILDERIALGFKVLRVFGMFDRFGIGGASGLGELNPSTIPDYYAKVRQFVDLLATRGLRVEWTILADADGRSDGTGGLLKTVAEQQAHITRTLAALAGAWNVADAEWSNEPFKNATHVAELTGDCPALHLICSYGIETLDFGQTSMPHLQIVTIHDHDRGSDWSRHGKALDELRNGFDWYDGDQNFAGHYEGVHIATVWDEPMGAADTDQPGRRFTSATEGRQAAATASLFGAGSTFHSDNGVASVLFSPTQKAAAKAWVEGAIWPPPDAQGAGYQRGGDCGSGGIGAMPLEHCDEGTPNAASTALRSFCKYSAASEWCVRIRAVGPSIPRDGWIVRETPWIGLVRLTR